MFCTNCGKMIPDGAAVCPNCGVGIAAELQQASGQAPIYNEVVPEAPSVPETPAVPDIPLSQPIPMDNAVYGDAPVQQNADPNAYQYQQNADPNAYQYQQNMDPNAYQYQQAAPQGTGYYDGFNAATPEQQNWNAGQPGQPGSSGGGGASLALGICSICIGVLGGIAFGVIGALIGIALGVVGLILAINFRKTNPGGAAGGLVTSIIGLALAAVMFIGCAACGVSTDGYGCMGCVGGTCGAANDVSNAARNYSKYFR